MEDVLILILQALGEFLFEVFAWWPWDWFWGFGEYRWDGQYGPSRTWIAVTTSLGMGAALGWLSLLIFPAVLVKWAWLRIALLFISPLLSGFMAWEMARWRQERRPGTDPEFHFWIGLCFSIGFVWLRFAFAHRPA